MDTEQVTDQATQESVELSQDAPVTQDSLFAPPVKEGQEQVESSDFLSQVPEEYKGEAWVKDIKDSGQLFKMLKDQKTALSKRPAGIPQDNATKEEWDAFNKAMGVPEKAEDYKIEVEGVNFNEEDRAFHEALKPAFKAAGITNRQLAMLAPEFQKVVTSLVGEQVSQEQRDKEFDALMNKTFGDRKQAVLDNGKKLLADVPGELLEGLAEVDNASLVRMAAVLDNIREKHISEDKIPVNGGPVVPTESREDLRTKARKVMASDAYRQSFHPEHKKAVEFVKKVYPNNFV